jgi:hypothetical protein
MVLRQPAKSQHGCLDQRLVRRMLHIRIALSTAWLLAAAGGFFALANHQSSEGTKGATPQQFPTHSRLMLDPMRDTLIMFAHPRCPCTRASIEELNHLLARSEGKVAAQVWFFTPSNSVRDWARSDSWQSAAAIPGVTVQEDRDGALARLLGAETSGYVLLYTKGGKLLFRGGITESRGHAGDNAGESAILALLAGEDSRPRETPVYGCALLRECRASQKLIQ